MKKLKICMLITCLIMCFSSITLAANFYDIKGTKYEGVVDRVARLGIINGVSETAFAPNKSITRAELAKMIVYTKGLQKYADTSGIKSNFKDTKGHWAESYIATAADLELLKGYGDGTFKPDKEVSYAEVVAIVIRGLGYVNIDEKEGPAWYSGYIKRMFEIEIDEGIEDYKSYESPAKRGDVAMMWWNMLVSDRWVVKSETDGSGLYYTYSPKPQLEVLFPDFYAIDGVVSSIANGTSGDTIGVVISGLWYETDSEVPIYSVGGRATAVYDIEEKRMYGFSIDDNLEEHKVISGPLFYLKEQGYNLKSAKTSSTLGSRSKANYAYVLISKETGEILRVVYLDTSNSEYVQTIEVKAPKKESKDEDEEDTTVIEFKEVFLNESETPYTNNNAVVIKNGKKVDWEELEEGIILTELIPGRLFTYENKTLNGNITDYTNLKELYIDNDKYLISSNCNYTIFGEYANEEEKELELFDYNKKMNKTKLESLLSRNTTFYLNCAEEIVFMQFGKYRPSSIIEKYDEGKYRFFYITSLTYSSGDDVMNVGGRTLSDKHLKFYLKPSDDFKVGDFVAVSEIDGKNAEKIELLSSDQMYEEEDISFLYDIEDEYYNECFGEYMMMDETVIYRVDKYYKDNSNDEIEEYRINRLSDVKQLGDLSKYQINLLCNNDMEIDIVFAERELNRTMYPVGRVVEVKKIKTLELDPDDPDYVPHLHVKITNIGGGSSTYKILSGDCALGELVTYESGDDAAKIKERFQTKFLGYANDVVIESFDKEYRVAKVKGTDEELDLMDTTFVFKGKEIDLLEYKYILAGVSMDPKTKEWRFTKGDFYAKEELLLKPGDRIAFGELNGIAVIYRGWHE